MGQTWFKKYTGPCLIALACFVTFLVPLIQGKTLGPWAQIRHLMPWNGPQPSRPWDVLQLDSVLQFYGWRDQVFHAWHNFQAPWWNPHILNGTPLLGNSQSGGFYPPHMLVGFSGIPTGVGILLLAIFHLALAGTGCYFLIRTLNGSELGATFGGAAFASSSFMIAWTPLSSVVETVAWIPWGLLFAQKFFSEPKSRVVSGLWLGVCLAMMTLAGHLQFAFYGFLAVGIWFVTGWINLPSQDDNGPGKVPHSRLHFGIGVGIAILVFVSLSFFQLSTVLQMGHQSHRQVSPTADGYSAYIAGADKWTELPSLATPSLLGTPNQSIGSDSEPLQAYWPAYTYRGSNFAETAMSWGPLVLFVLACGYRKLRWKQIIPLISIGAVGGLLAFGTPLNWLLYSFVPGWAATGSPGRAGCLLVLTGCIIAGLALSDLNPETTKSSLKFGSLCLVITCLAGVVIMNLQSGNVWNPIFAKLGVLGAIGPKVVIGVALSWLLVALFAGVLTWQGKFQWRPALIVGLCFLQPLILYPVLSFGTPSLPIESQAMGRIAIVTGPWNLLTSPTALAPPNTAALSGLDEVGGYDSLIRKEAQERVSAINQGPSSPPENGNMMEVSNTFDPDKLADSGVSEVWSQTLLPQLKTKPTQVPFGFIYPLLGPGRASTPTGIAKVTHEDATSVTVQANGPGPLILRDDLQPDWYALVDGKRQELQWTPWPTVSIPNAGPHTATFMSGRGQAATRFGWIFLGGFGFLLLVGGYFSQKSVQLAKKVS